MYVNGPKEVITPQKIIINQVLGQNELHEEINKMAHGVVDDSARYYIMSFLKTIDICHVCFLFIVVLE